MKITINNKEHNWYLADLDCYTPEFLKEIIIDLAEKSARVDNKEVKTIILDNNPLSIACYLEEHQVFNQQ
jgi:hypothetical protein